MTPSISTQLNEQTGRYESMMSLEGKRCFVADGETEYDAMIQCMTYWNEHGINTARGENLEAFVMYSEIPVGTRSATAGPGLSYSELNQSDTASGGA